MEGNELDRRRRIPEKRKEANVACSLMAARIDGNLEEDTRKNTSYKVNKSNLKYSQNVTFHFVDL